MTARRGLNLAYARVVENLSKEDRAEFDSEISRSLVELQVMRAIQIAREKQDRVRLAAEYGEVG